MAKETLTEEQVKELQAWSAEFLQLPVHLELQHQMNLCMQGIEQGFVIGARGAGKTYSVRWLINEIQAAEVERSLSEPGYEPREVLYYEASRATGTKTALIDLYEVIFGYVSKAASRFHTARSLVEQIAAEMQRRNIALICVDEAQMIDAANLDLLRQVPDVARGMEHSVGLILVGSEELRDSLARIKQLGQRFSGEVRFPRIDRSQIAPLLPAFHPHLGPLKAKLKAKEWNRLENEFFTAVNGNFRRLVTLLRNANALALRLSSPVDARVLQLAIGKLAEEV